MFKKVFRLYSTLLVAILIFTNCPLQISAADADVNDVNNIVRRYQALGIIGEDVQTTGEMTRGEFSQLFLSFLNITPVNKGISTYVDVDVEDPCCDAALTLFELGYMSGYDNKMFYPDVNITYNEVVSVFVNAMGYKAIAQSKGGWPNGYLHTASVNDMLDGVMPMEDNKITAEGIYKIFDNCMEASVYAVSGIKVNDGETYNEYTKENALKYYHGITKYEGRLTRNHYTSLMSSEGLSENRLEFDNRFSYNSAFSADSLLGYDVAYYVRNANEDEETLLYVEATERNETLEINTEDIVQITDSTLLYEANGKEKKAKLSNTVEVIYNGVFYSGFGNYNKLIPKNGSIKCLDYDSDNVIDTLFVNDYINIVVAGIDKDNFVFSDKISNGRENLNDSKQNVIIYDENNNVISAKDIVKDDVLSIQRSKNEQHEKLVTVNVSKKVITGMVESIDNGTDRYTIDGIEYEFDSDVSVYPKLSQNIDIYLDYTGKIAMWESTNDSDLQYGILMATAIESGIEQKLLLRVYSQDGKIKILTCSDKITVNDGKREESYKFLSVLNNSANSLIRYRISSDGTVNKIYTVTTDNLLQEISNGTEMRATHGVVNWNTATDSETIIFSVPTDTNDEDAFSMVTLSKLPKDKRTVAWKAFAFDQKKFPVADVIVVKDFQNDEITNETPIAYVKRIMKVLFDDEAVDAIEVLVGNIETQYVDTDGYLKSSNIKAGDIVRCGVNANNEITAFEKVLTHDSTGPIVPLVSPTTYATNVSSVDHKISYGRITDISDMYLKYELEYKDSTINTFEMFNLTDTTITVLISDSDFPEMTKVGSVGDFMVDDTILVHYRYSVPYEVVILR